LDYLDAMPKETKKQIAAEVVSPNPSTNSPST
jgi:hypothetical protein